MPRGDGTGPVGAGSMTGRAAGYCAGYGVPGYMNPVPPRGFGGGYGRGGGRAMFGRARGRGMGRGVGSGYYAPGPYGYEPPYSQTNPKSERQFLEDQAEILQEEMEEIKQRLAELKSQEAKKE